MGEGGEMMAACGVPKKIYLDQSFWSDVYNAQESSQGKSYDRVKRIFLLLQKLKSINKVRIVVSDIHVRETSAFPEAYSEKRKAVWDLQNWVADGKIADNWGDVFIAQHRRLLGSHNNGSYPIEDLGLTEIKQPQARVRIIMANKWRLRHFRQCSPTTDAFNSDARKIIENQARNIPQCKSADDCLNYIRGLWHDNIEQGISTRLETLDIMWRFEQDGELPSVEQMKAFNEHSGQSQIVSSVTRDMNEVVMLNKWSELLESDSVGPCPSLRIRTAFEAEILFTWCQEKKRNPKKFGDYFGLSRQNDIDHVATFVPYVDALTTDNPMRNLCKRKIVAEELSAFKCEVYSTQNYDEFENWLTELLAK